MILFLITIGGYLLLLKSCIVKKPDIKKLELIEQGSELLPQGEKYFISKKYLYSERILAVVGGNVEKVEKYSYGINNADNKVVLKPFSAEPPTLVKIYEYDKNRNLHEDTVWWSQGRVRSSYYFPFPENGHKIDLFTKDGKQYKNRNKNYCIVKDNLDKYHLIDLKKRKNIFQAYEMYWKSPTEIIYRYTDFGLPEEAPSFPNLKMTHKSLITNEK